MSTPTRCRFFRSPSALVVCKMRRELLKFIKDIDNNDEIRYDEFNELKRQERRWALWLDRFNDANKTLKWLSLTSLFLGVLWFVINWDYKLFCSSTSSFLSKWYRFYYIVSAAVAAIFISFSFSRHWTTTTARIISDRYRETNSHFSLSICTWQRKSCWQN